MGIPSYFRFLIDKNPSLVKKSFNKVNRTYLCFDLNCIVYNCLSKSVYDGSNLEEYEHTVIQETCKYIEYVWRSSGKCEEVLLAVDGVVPMAKMKQQRLRRFKSTVMVEYEIQQNVRKVDEPRWDSNAITPGTLFMKKLHASLKELCDSHTSWTLSGYNSNGEGEHKIMSFIRKMKTKDSTIIVYGLDADLILLSMIHSEDQNIYLMREELEFNHVVKDKFNDPQFLYFDISSFKNKVIPDYSKQKMLDYIVMMSFLGNDFVPHSIAFTIKENGHTFLYETLKNYKKHLVDSKNSIIWNNVKEFLKLCVLEEENKIETFCKKKSQIKFFRVNREHASEYEMKMAPVQILPCQWYVEKELYNEETSRLRPDWKNLYYSKFLSQEKERVIEEYLKGIQWILDYYIGNPIEYDWYYPWMYTPLWEDVVSYLTKKEPDIKYRLEKWLEPEQQLAIVLPVQSYNLITDIIYKQFPVKYPQFYPISFGFHSLGKKWFYECESNIPIFSSKFLRSIV